MNFIFIVIYSAAEGMAVGFIIGLIAYAVARVIYRRKAGPDAYRLKAQSWAIGIGAWLMIGMSLFAYFFTLPIDRGGADVRAMARMSMLLMAVFLSPAAGASAGFTYHTAMRRWRRN